MEQIDPDQDSASYVFAANKSNRIQSTPVPLTGRKNPRRHLEISIFFRSHSYNQPRAKSYLFINFFLLLICIVNFLSTAQLLTNKTSKRKIKIKKIKKLKINLQALPVYINDLTFQNTKKSSNLNTLYQEIWCLLKRRALPT